MTIDSVLKMIEKKKANVDILLLQLVPGNAVPKLGEGSVRR